MRWRDVLFLVAISFSLGLFAGLTSSPPAPSVQHIVEQAIARGDVQPGQPWAVLCTRNYADCFAVQVSITEVARPKAVAQ